MKICMMVSNDVLNDPRVTRHAESLGRHGHNVTVLGTKTKRSAPIEISDHYRILRIRLATYDRLKSSVDNIKMRRQVVREAHPGPLSGLADERPFIARRLVRRLSDISMDLTRLFDMNLRMARVARSLRADVYTSNDLDTLLAGVIASSGRKYLIYDSHEMWTDMWISMPHSLRSFFRSLEKTLIKRTNVVMTVNEFIARELARRYHIELPYVVLNCSEHVPAQPVVRVKKSGTKVALYQGRYAPGRGLDNVIRACEYLGKDVTLLMRGFGEIEPDLRKLAQRYDNCKFAAPVPMKDMVTSAAEADVGILSYLPINLGYLYASPNKLFEYIQAGLPVVATDLPFLRKVILEQRIGRLFDSREPKSIAEAINAVTRESTLREMKENVVRAARVYNWANEERKMIQIYEMLTSAE